MIATLPAVQFNCHRHHIYCFISPQTIRYEKRNANRRHRRALNRATRMMCRDPERWWNEGFDAPSLSSWDLW